MLRYTNVEIELLTDPDMHAFVQSAIRGGFSGISHRQAKANFPASEKYGYAASPDYDPTEEHEFLMYLDVCLSFKFDVIQKHIDISTLD